MTYIVVWFDLIDAGWKVDSFEDQERAQEYYESLRDDEDHNAIEAMMAEVKLGYKRD